MIYECIYEWNLYFAMVRFYVARINISTSENLYPHSAFFIHIPGYISCQNEPYPSNGMVGSFVINNFGFFTRLVNTQLHPHLEIVNCKGLAKMLFNANVCTIFG